jgi:hypothetical protein
MYWPSSRGASKCAPTDTGAKRPLSAHQLPVHTPVLPWRLYRGQQQSESGAGKGGSNGHAEDSSGRHPSPRPGTLPGRAAHWVVLARLGAEVIKVEAPRGDESRSMGPFVRGQSAYWVQYNSGKKSLDLDLRNAEVVVGSAPLPGQHTAEILTSLLHYTPEEVKKLESEGAVYCSAAL